MALTSCSSELVCGLLLLLWVNWLWRRRHFYRFSLRFPGTWGLPFIGSLHRIGSMQNFIPFAGGLFERCKTFNVCFWLGLSPVVMTADPEFIKDITISSDFLYKAELLYKSIDNAFQGGLIALGGKEWQRHRKLLHPAFSHKVLLSFFPVFNKASLSIKEKFQLLADGQPHTVLHLLQRMTLNAAVETTMGKSIQEGDKVDEKVAKIFQYVLGAVTDQVYYAAINLYPLTVVDFKFKRGLSYIREFIQGLIKRKLRLEESSATSQSRLDSNDVRKDENIFIDHAIKLVKQNKFSMDNVVAESYTIVSASMETTSMAIFSTIVLLAMHPEVQERLFQEILSEFPNEEFEVDYEHLGRLKYLEMIFNECLRLMPPVPFVGRQVVKDSLVKCDILLPKGFQVLLSIFHLHRRKDLWGEDAALFNPERFSPSKIANIKPYQFMPFSKGPRNCIGWNYATLFLKVAIIHLIRHFEFETDVRLEDLRFLEKISLHFEQEPGIKIKRRL